VSNLHPIRDVIWQAADESEREILLKRWQSEKDQPKESKPVSTMQSTNLLTRLVEEQISAIEVAAAKAESAKREQEAQLIAQKDQVLRQTFSKLIEADVAHVQNGFLYFDYQDRKFRVYRDSEGWRLEDSKNNVPIESEHADVLRKLALTLAKILQKVPA
jgi:hypothetical protein